MPRANNKQSKNKETAQAKIADKYLRGLLDKACLSLDIRTADWDLDKTLYASLINSPKIKTKKSLVLFSNFDHCYTLLKELKIDVNIKYKWFTDIHKHI